MKIIEAIWFTEFCSEYSLGIVVVKPEVGKRKAYIGRGFGKNENDDIHHIADYGAKIYPEQLRRVLELLEEKDSQKDKN